MANEFGTKKDVSPDYLNGKLESMMAAIYDTLGETEERLKNIEKIIFELRNGSKETN